MFLLQRLLLLLLVVVMVVVVAAAVAVGVLRSSIISYYTLRVCHGQPRVDIMLTCRRRFYGSLQTVALEPHRKAGPASLSFTLCQQ